jgi:hypothetical protein
MRKHTVTITAKNLGLIIQAFNMLKGPKSIMLAYKIGRILEPVHKLQGEFIKRVGPFVDEVGNLKEDLTEEQRELVETLVNEPLTFEIPTLELAGTYRGWRRLWP